MSWTTSFAITIEGLSHSYRQRITRDAQSRSADDLTILLRENLHGHDERSSLQAGLEQ
jgi:hypothetical protein